ncbi:MAG: ATP-binding protein [Ruminococcus sp.]|nr:ATP-binding protein [Ruminococcus sp.]
MEEKQFRNDKTNKKLEQIVLGIFTLFSLAMLLSSYLLAWNLIAREIIVATIIAAWVIHLKKYRDYGFRAKFLAAVSWINFAVYAVYSQSFTSMLSTMLALIALLGIFCSEDIVYLGVIMTTLIFLYHGFVSQTISVQTANDIIRMLLHVLSAYAISLVTWITIRIRQETSEKLIENIHELEIVEQSKDDFMVNISHEIRTPINAVCGMSEAILQENLPVDVRRDVIDIQTAGRNLLSTVSNILDFSELESGKMELAEESYNITSTITDIINMALTMENGKHLELIVDCDADLPSNLLGDEQKLRRIVMNLLENAIKFTKEGGIVLRIKSRKEEYGINLLVSIKDSGIGMSQADMEKIFTSFGQLNSRRNREEGGIGLGLAITQALVQNMGGFITVESMPDRGTTFQFTIPQKVLDETPIVSIKNKSHLFAACYINMDKYNYTVVREGYERCIRHIAEQFGIMFRICKNLPELKRRIDHENYSHIFISWEEYCEDRNFFEQLAKELTVVLILDYGQETQIGSNMLRIYKPFTVLSIAAVFNGQKVLQRGEQHLDLRHRFIAPDAKVLVVDDNAMNLKVMARLLLPYQIKVSMASGGQEALDKLDGMEYDCVFLDHMMPEMDGVETLHKIRQKPGSYFQALSVIAFTANAIGGAREMFMDEGFTDFIAKPIELSVLERMLRRYIPVQKQISVEEDMEDTTENSLKESTDKGKANAVTAWQNDGASAGAAQTAAADGRDKIPAAGKKETEAEALDALRDAGINIEQGISYCGDQEGLREIITIYHAEGARRNEQLEQFVKEQDWKNYVITVHALKSNSKGIGANELAELALNLEMAGKENRIEYILDHHEELMEKHNALLTAFARNTFLYPDGYEGEKEEKTAAQTDVPDGNGAEGNVEMAAESSESGGTEAAGAADEAVLKERLTFLRAKLDSFESDGLDGILEQLKGCRYQELDLTDMVNEIKVKVDDFDFLGAGEVLGSWEEKIAKGTM